DGVVLDLVYEARDIEQSLGSQDKVDAWFEAKSKGLNDWQKAALREQWGTMQKVLSSRSRMERVVEDIVFDFGVKPRLSSQRGNAMLVASSIYEASKYFRAVPKDRLRRQVRAHHVLQSPGAGRDAGGNRGQHRDREAIPLEYLHSAAQKRRREARQDQDRELRGRRQSAVQDSAREHEAASRGGQAADRLRRAALHVSLY